MTGRVHGVIAGSIGLHAVVFACLSRCELPTPVARAVEPAPTPVEVALEVPVGIDLVTLENASSGGGATTASSISSSGRGRGHLGAEHGGADTELPTRGTGTESLRMRGRRHQLTLSGDALDRILQNTKPLEPIVTDERLLPRGGEHVIHDRVATMRVEKDGTAHLRDQPDFDAKLKLPIMSVEQFRTGLGRQLTAWSADPYRDQRAGRTQDIARHITAVPGACEKWGDVACEAPEDRPAKSMSDDAAVVPVVGGKADLTGWLHRKFIGDPYASRKLKLLDTTREARAQIGANHRSEQRDRASEFAQRNLDALWKATTDLAERKAALFALWDECSEEENKDGEAGARARAIVVGWIRAKLPAGSPSAFTSDEIAKLDANRTSREHFAPYR